MRRAVAAAVVGAVAAAGGFDREALGQWVTPPVTAARVQYRTFQSTAAGTTVSYHVYVPAAYDAQPERRFATLYWLHGYGGGLAGIAPLSAWFDAAIERGDIPPMLVVFANGFDSMWCDSFDGSVPMETVVITELIPAVDAALRTVPSREGRLVEGFSMGGYGSARFAFGHPGLFAGVSILGGGPLQTDFFDAPTGVASPAERARIFQEVWGGSAAYYYAQSPWARAEQNAAAIISAGMVVRQAVGLADSMLAANIDLDAHLTQLGIAHTFTTPAGVGHDTLALLTALGAANWRFYRAALRESDLDGDGCVGAGDLGALLGSWGGEGVSDINGDGVTSAADLAVMLGAWGAGC